VARVVLIAALALVAACARVRVAPIVLPDRPVLALLTWNLHAGRGDLRRLIDDLRSGRLTGDMPVPEFALLLQETDADVVDLARRLGLSAFFAPTRVEDGTERGIAVLATRPLIDARAIELPRERQRRMAIAAFAEVDGQRLLVANVHLENRASWWRGGLPGDRARERQMRALVADLPADVPGVLGGDFNTWLGPAEAAYRLAAEQFRDEPPGQPSVTFGNRLPLDHLLFRLPPGWTAHRARASSRYGSDHYPVVAVLGRPIGTPEMSPGHQGENP
jgi:endonuclease/exonuclease/phosphatase family metal-dependent hydrolase